MSLDVGITEILMIAGSILGSLGMFWVSAVHKRLNSMDERLRDAISRDGVKELVEVMIEPIEVQTNDIKNDIANLDTKLDKIIDKLLDK